MNTNPSPLRFVRRALEEARVAICASTIDSMCVCDSAEATALRDKQLDALRYALGILCDHVERLDRAAGIDPEPWV